MEKMIRVRCGNPFFKGKACGVQFHQATGGAIGHATAKQAAELEKEGNFRIDDTPEVTLTEPNTGTPDAGQPAGTGSTPPITAVKGIGAKIAAALASAGIATLEDLADASTDLIVQEGITTAEVATEWRKQALEILGQLPPDEEE